MGDFDADPSQTVRKSRAGELATFAATGLGVGFFPFAPGTLGALWGLPLAWGLQHLSPIAEAAGVVAVCLVGIPLCTSAARQLGRKDPGAIVLDEIASLPISFYAIDILDVAGAWRIILAGFLLHRLFDVTKPPPARQLESLPGGLGIMADDWAAAVYANLALRLLLWLEIV